MSSHNRRLDASHVRQSIHEHVYVSKFYSERNDQVKKWSKIRVLSIIRDVISPQQELQKLRAAVEVYRLPCTDVSVDHVVCQWGASGCVYSTPNLPP
jgi:hypothetical protein